MQDASLCRAIIIRHFRLSFSQPLNNTVNLVALSRIRWQRMDHSRPPGKQRHKLSDRSNSNRRRCFRTVNRLNDKNIISSFQQLHGQSFYCRPINRRGLKSQDSIFLLPGHAKVVATTVGCQVLPANHHCQHSTPSFSSAGWCVIRPVTDATLIASIVKEGRMETHLQPLPLFQRQSLNFLARTDGGMSTMDSPAGPIRISCNSPCFRL